jgi:hypothetical protein
MRVWCKGTMTTGTAGIGIIWADPRLGIQNDSPCVYASDAAFALATFALPLPNTIPDTSANGVHAFASNSDYLAASIGAAAATYRVVSSCIRCRYVGTELNRGGTCVALSDTNHNSLLLRTFSNMDAEINSKRFAVDRKWICVTYRPVTTQDIVFSDSSLSPINPGTLSQAWYQGIMVQAPAGAPSVYEWEYYSTYEAQGPNVRGQTRSHNDPIGNAAVNTVTNFSKHLEPYQGDPAPKEKSILKDTLDVLGTTMSKAEPYIDKAATFVTEPLVYEAIGGLMSGFTSLL